MEDKFNQQSTIESWVKQYVKARPLYQEFCTQLKTLLETLLSKKSIRYHIVEERAKSIESFSEKLQRYGKAYHDPLKEISDLAGLRIIVYYEDDADLVCNLLEQEFNIDPRSVDKRATFEPDRFGYLSVHKIVSLSKIRAKLPEWSEFSGLVAEIQVRTVLQHAWATISHALQYKNKKEVPLQLRRKLIRLSGLLELADEEFLELRQKQEKLGEEITERIEEKDLEIAINALSLNKFLTSSPIVGNLMEVISPIEYLGVEKGSFVGVSQLIAVCEIVRIRNIKELEDLLVKLSPKAKSFFSSFAYKRKNSIGDPAHWVAVLITAGKYNETIHTKIRNRGIWNDEYTVDIGKSSKVFL